MDERLEKWLEEANSQFRKEEIPYISRPFEAISRLSKQHGLTISFPSEFANSIFRWFEEHSPVGAHAVGSLFTSCFYYDAYFWPVEIFLAFGTVNLDAMDSLKKMPQSIKAQFRRESRVLWQYISLWTDSLDYAFGIDDLDHGRRMPNQGNQLLAANFTLSADRELRGCVRLLTESREPNSRALESARMAMEMFLKAFLAVHSQLSEETARKYGHNLSKLTGACAAIKPSPEVEELRGFVDVFPTIGARYEGSDYEKHQLWSGYAAALRTGVTLIRTITDRDNRNKITVRA